MTAPLSRKDEPPMRWVVGEDRRVRPFIDEEMIERGAEAIRDFLGGEWREFNGGSGLAEVVLRAALQEPATERTEENETDG